MTKLFISHSSQDDAFVRDLRAALADHGQDGWIDSRELRGGDPLWTEIEKAIDAASAYAVVVSPKAFESKWVGKELPTDLLRNHIYKKACLQTFGAGQLTRRGRSGLGQSEIEHLDAALVGDLDVAGLQIAMHDPRLVRDVERVGNLPRVIDRLVDRDRSRGDTIGKRVARYQLEHEGRLTAALDHVVNRGDVGMIERGEGPRFALEADDRIPIGGNAG